MTTPNYFNPYAFPSHGSMQEGMSLRDYFAGQALPQVMREFLQDARDGAFQLPEDWRCGVAIDAYKMADAMLKAREPQ